jgi:predicted deacylase
VSRLAVVLALLVAGPAAAERREPATPFEILGTQVGGGERRDLALPVGESFTGSELAMGVVVVHGPHPGPVLCLTAGVHGDEVNGIEVVRRLLADLDPARVSGTVVGVPIVNPHGFRRGSRYAPDRRDLNRHFPGRRYGSAASRIAHALFEQVVRRCDHLLDFHTGSLERTNYPHARGDLEVPGVAELVLSLDGWLVLQHQGRPGTLRRAATDAGIATLTFEVGGPVRLDEEAVRQTLEAVRRMPGLGATRARRAPVEVYGRSRWVRVDDGGLLLTRVTPGDRIKKDQILGVVVDPIASQESVVRAPAPGRLIGMAWSQVVIPGFAAFNLATVDSDEAPAVGAEAVAPEEIPE